MGMTFINYIQKRFNSILFRLTCIIYAVIIVNISTNSFPQWVYYVGIIIYIITYFNLRKYSHCRLLADFGFIIFTLYGKDININFCYIFTLLPIINSINYSGKSKSFILLYLGTCISIAILKGTINIHDFIAPIILLFIDIYSWKKRKTNDILYELTEHVDAFFTQSNVIQKPHQIYESIILEINTFFKGSYINSIYCYVLKEDNMLWLINSSEFIWDRTLKLEIEQIDLLCQNKQLNIIDKDNQRLFYLIEVDAVKYVFVCNTNKNLPLYYQIIGVDYIFIAVFSKIANLLNYEYRVFEYKNKTFDDMREKQSYVNVAVKIMHYIRNKLTPLTNIVEYYSNEEKISSEVKAKMANKIRREIKQSNKDLHEIVETANYMLEKSNNPFDALEIREISIKKLFVILSEIDERLLSGIVTINKNIVDVEDKFVVRTSLTETKILFADWINNMRKYKKDKFKICFSIEGEYIRIDFYNDYTISHNECEMLIKDINNNQKDAVLQRKTHGIYQIKSIAQSLDLELKASKEKEEDKDKKDIIHYLRLSINYKIFNKNEDTSN